MIRVKFPFLACKPLSSRVLRVPGLLFQLWASRLTAHTASTAATKAMARAVERSSGRANFTYHRYEGPRFTDGLSKGKPEKMQVRGDHSLKYWYC